MSKKSVSVLLALAVLIGGGIALLFWRNNDDDLQTSSNVQATKYDNIQFDIESGWSDTEQFHIVYPLTENESINQQIAQSLDDKRTAFEGRIDGQSTVADLHVNTDVNFATDEVVLFEIFTTDSTDEFTGEVVETWFFDRKTGERYGIDVFFDDDDYLETLSDLTRQQLSGQFEDDDLVALGTLPELENFDAFGIKSEDAVFIDFEPGQVAPVDVGIVQVDIALDDLSSILSETFEEKVFQGFLAEQDRAAAEVANQVDLAGVQPQAVEFVDCDAQKCAALTFDDGPHPTNTPKLLDTFEKYNVKGTFFMIGQQVPANAELVKRMADAGHVLGIHTWDHKDLTKLSAADAKSEIDRTAQAIANAAGVQPYLVRPPYGAINDEARAAFNLPTIEWNVDPEDWKDRNADTVFSRVTANTKNGSIVLSHDIHETTVEAYERIVPQLLDDGFTLVTVPQLLDFTPGNVPVDNYFSR